MEQVKSYLAMMWSVLVWMVSLTLQEMITFGLATLLTIASIIFVIYGIKTRALDAQIKQEELKKMKAENENS